MGLRHGIHEHPGRPEALRNGSRDGLGYREPPHGNPFAAAGYLVHGGPCPPFRFFLSETLVLVAFLNAFHLAFLFSVQDNLSPPPPGHGGVPVRVWPRDGRHSLCAAARVCQGQHSPPCPLRHRQGNPRRRECDHSRNRAVPRLPVQYLLTSSALASCWMILFSFESDIGRNAVLPVCWCWIRTSAVWISMHFTAPRVTAGSCGMQWIAGRHSRKMTIQRACDGEPKAGTVPAWR